MKAPAIALFLETGELVPFTPGEQEVILDALQARIDALNVEMKATTSAGERERCHLVIVTCARLITAFHGRPPRDSKKRTAWRLDAAAWFESRLRAYLDRPPAAAPDATGPGDLDWTAEADRRLGEEQQFNPPPTEANAKE